VQGVRQRTINEKNLRQMLTYSSTFDGKNLYAVSKGEFPSETREPVTVARIAGIPVDKEPPPREAADGVRGGCAAPHPTSGTTRPEGQRLAHFDPVRGGPPKHVLTAPSYE